MINDIIVIDDAISKSYQDLIEQSIVENLEFPWYFSPAITTTESFQNDPMKKKDTTGWAHKFFDVESNGKTSFIADLLMPLMHEACGKIRFYPTKLLQGRIFSLTPALDKIQHIWHVDLLDPHLVCLYYVNDSTGPTIISAESVVTRKSRFISADTDLKIAKKVDPKKGRIVLFDGRLYHAPTNPEDGRRVIINFDIV
jgi:hypothetical protein